MDASFAFVCGSGKDPDPGYGFFTSGCGIGKKSRSGSGILDLFDLDHGSRMEKFGAGIIIPQHGWRQGQCKAAIIFQRRCDIFHFIKKMKSTGTQKSRSLLYNFFRVYLQLLQSRATVPFNKTQKNSIEIVTYPPFSIRKEEYLIGFSLCFVELIF